MCGVLNRNYLDVLQLHPSAVSVSIIIIRSGNTIQHVRDMAIRFFKLYVQQLQKADHLAEIFVGQLSSTLRKAYIQNSIKKLQSDIKSKKSKLRRIEKTLFARLRTSSHGDRRRVRISSLSTCRRSRIVEMSMLVEVNMLDNDDS